MSQLLQCIHSVKGTDPLIVVTCTCLNFIFTMIYSRGSMFINRRETTVHDSWALYHAVLVGHYQGRRDALVAQLQ